MRNASAGGAQPEPQLPSINFLTLALLVFVVRHASFYVKPVGWCASIQPWLDAECGPLLCASRPPSKADRLHHASLVLLLVVVLSAWGCALRVRLALARLLFVGLTQWPQLTSV